MPRVLTRRRSLLLKRAPPAVQRRVPVLPHCVHISSRLSPGWSPFPATITIESTARLMSVPLIGQAGCRKKQAALI